MEQNPLSLVMMHPAEDVFGYGRTKRLILRFIKHGLHEKTGLNLVEFMQLPTYLVNAIFEMSTKATFKSDSELQAVIDATKAAVSS